jgi:hypothetical protein
MNISLPSLTPIRINFNKGALEVSCKVSTDESQNRVSQSVFKFCSESCVRKDTERPITVDIGAMARDVREFESLSASNFLQPAVGFRRKQRAVMSRQNHGIIVPSEPSENGANEATNSKKPPRYAAAAMA